MAESQFIFSFPVHRDERGLLGVADSLDEKVLPFVARRVFWIAGVPPGSERGGHAHRSCHEAVVCISGSCRITLVYPGIKHNSPATDRPHLDTPAKGFLQQDFLLDNPGKALHIPPMVWCRLHSFTADCTLLCFASEPYNASGYLNDFMLFKQECIV